MGNGKQELRIDMNILAHNQLVGVPNAHQYTS